MAKRPAGRDSKTQIFKAAATEFAEHGYAGAGVDRIAAKARVNKAMLYYHFGSKADLYRAVLQDMFQPLSARVREIADAPGEPARKVDLWIATIVAEATARPHFPPIMLRELASGGEHLDADTVKLIGGVYAAVRDIISEGQSKGAFRRMNPLLVNFTVVPTVMFYLARNRAIAKGGVRGSDAITEPISGDDFVRHMQDVVHRMLSPESRLQE